MSSKRNDDFYKQLEAFDTFERISDSAVFEPVPDDWYVVIADIKGSTKAIAAGRYKDVNMVGAACITGTLNGIKAAAGDEIDIPYSFGGDGATLMVPESVIAAARASLVGVSEIAQRESGLELRAGAVPARDLRARGVDVRVAKMRLSPGNAMAMFDGGGVEMADKLIKEEDGTGGYRFDGSMVADETGADLTGLSCRWEPLAARNGKMVSMIVRALDAEEDGRRRTYKDILTQLSGVLGRELRDGRPIAANNMRFKWIPKGLRLEARLTRGQGGFLRRYCHLVAESFIQYLLEVFNLEAGSYDAPVYREELRSNSDYRRFDDVLRLILDCTEQQTDAVDAILADLRAKGRIAYGLHIADHALMTCLVFSLEQHQHVHFIDGGEGGFTAAAVPYKRQMAELSRDG